MNANNQKRASLTGDITMINASKAHAVPKRICKVIKTTLPIKKGITKGRLTLNKFANKPREHKIEKYFTLRKEGFFPSKRVKERLLKPKPPVMSL